MAETTMFKSPETPPPEYRAIGITTPESSTNKSRTNKHASLGTPETPLVEPLTPSGTEYDDINSVAFYVRLPLLLDELLGASSVLVSSEIVRVFLISRPLPDRKQLRSVFEKLYQCCAELCLDTQDGSEGILESHAKYSPLHSTDENEEHSNESDNGTGDYMKSLGSLETGSLDMPFGSSESGRKATEEINFGYMESLAKSEHLVHRYQRLPADVRHDWQAEPDHDSIRSKGVSVQPDDEIFASDMVYVDNEVIPEQIDQINCINPRVLEKIQHYPKPAAKKPHKSTPQVRNALRTPGAPSRTPKAQLPAPKTGPSDSDSAISTESSMDMAFQTTSEFVQESLEQVERFELCTNSQKTYGEIFAFLNEPDSGDKDTWMSGAGWKILVESAFCDQQKGNIHYALTAVALSRWHHNQTQRESSLSRKKVAGKVSKMIIGEEPDDISAKEAWERKRKSFNAHLTRGRKWSTLAKEFGYGVLFKNVWKLGKSSNDDIKNLILLLKKNATKLAVLELMNDQMELLLKNGRTEPDVFRKRLEEQKLAEPLPSPPRTYDRVSDLKERMRDLLGVSRSKLQLKDKSFMFDPDVLDGTDWFNDELILLCLHLADKLPGVRVGFSIPIHQQKFTTKMMARPFERAAKEIQRSRDAGRKKGQLVHFFPLLQHENHFSLLEVNEMDNCIYHYDALAKGPKKNIKKALIQEKQFQGMNYIDEPAPRQLDGFSCGPLVIAFARSRMLGQSLTPKDISRHKALQLRVDVLDLIEKAWHSGIICAVDEASRGKKRRTEDETDGFPKRVHRERFDAGCAFDTMRVVIDVDG
ncbi:hypothetical protein F4810DRAFT_723856 [Camillea tinctor]|nr:hypothetical protein F4810DRAFT_723856 [Camillea tinctor]